VSAPHLAGSALMVAGVFQFTRLKDACLSHCRSPFGYFATHWRPGVVGALSMGVRHGIFCLGCCWAIMALALVVGMMDGRMMVVLMGLMLLETLGPTGARLSRPIGVGLMIVAGALFLA
jgi:predicted metal-binding membrane protein